MDFNGLHWTFELQKSRSPLIPPWRKQIRGCTVCFSALSSKHCFGFCLESRMFFQLKKATLWILFFSLNKMYPSDMLVDDTRKIDQINLSSISRSHKHGQSFLRTCDFSVDFGTHVTASFVSIFGTYRLSSSTPS